MKPTPYPQEEEESGLLVSAAFWWGAVLSIAMWSALYLIVKDALQ